MHTVYLIFRSIFVLITNVILISTSLWQIFFFKYYSLVSHINLLWIPIWISNVDEICQNREYFVEISLSLILIIFHSILWFSFFIEWKSITSIAYGNLLNDEVYKTLLLYIIASWIFYFISGFVNLYFVIFCTYWNCMLKYYNVYQLCQLNFKTIVLYIYNFYTYLNEMYVLF